MARKPKARKKVKPAKRSERAPPSILLAILSLLGLVLTTSLLVVSITKSALPYCASGSGCEIVQSSRWSTLLGLPITAWGWATYAILTSAALFAARRVTRWRIIVFFGTIAFGVSVYLNAVSIWILGTVCMYCIASLALVTAIYLLTWRADGLFGLSSWRFGSSAAALVIVALLALHYSGAFDPTAGPEDPYLKALAEYLVEIDAKFYGAYWCPHCQQQKMAFGASAHRLPYTECSPNGQRGAPATACLIAEIKNYPTWVIEGRRLDRTLTVEELARYAGFRKQVGRNEL
ncbi:MAG TPA: Vitamin K epoxide reductase [Gammaproteobacteria bacterium]|mgnify:CR=1 FL=1|nr:Vitamin K epoxide reductase [Gammaproteobacteria bacterium]